MKTGSLSGDDKAFVLYRVPVNLAVILCALIFNVYDSFLISCEVIDTVVHNNILAMFTVTEKTMYS